MGEARLNAVQKGESFQEPQSLQRKESGRHTILIVSKPLASGLFPET